MLIALGNAGRSGLLTVLDRSVTIPETVAAEVTTEPAASNLHALVESGDSERQNAPTITDEPSEPRTEARELLDETEATGDVAIVGIVIEHRQEDADIAVLSDDRRVRRVAEGLGANVTGTIGVVVRAVAEERIDATDGKRLVARLDERGLHMTAELRERAEGLVEDAATDSE